MGLSLRTDVISACGQITSQLVDRFHLSPRILDLQPSTGVDVAQQNGSPSGTNHYRNTVNLGYRESRPKESRLFRCNIAGDFFSVKDSRNLAL